MSITGLKHEYLKNKYVLGNDMFFDDDLQDSI